MSEINNKGFKGRFFMWVVIAFALLIALIVFVYSSNFDGIQPV